MKFFEDIIGASDPKQGTPGVCGDCVHWGQYPSTIGGFCKNMSPRGNRRKDETCGDFTAWPEVNSEGEYNI